MLKIKSPNKNSWGIFRIELINIPKINKRQKYKRILEELIVLPGRFQKMGQLIFEFPKEIPENMVLRFLILN